MKLIIFLSVAILVRCDYPTTEPDASSESDPGESGQEHSVASSIAPIDATKHFFSFPTIYSGAFPPSSIPPANFLSSFPLPQYKFPSKPLTNPPSQISFGTSPQGILPPLSEIIPPISQIVPPIFGGAAKPSLPPTIKPPQIVPPALFPPKPSNALGLQLPKYTYNYRLPYYYNPLSQYYYNKTPFTFPFPSTAFASSIASFQEPIKIKEPLPSAYGPPSSAPAESSPSFEPPADSSSSFDPSSASYPYEPALPETSESTPYKPAQEYGPPNKK